MWVEPKPSPGDAAVELGEEQRQLGQLLRGQPAGVVRLVAGDDGLPDGDRVELGMVLGALLPLAFQYVRVEIAQLMPAQVDTLIGQEMRGCPEYLVRPSSVTISMSVPFTSKAIARTSVRILVVIQPACSSSLAWETSRAP